MNFIQIKDHFSVLSGRYDLIDNSSRGTLEMIFNHASRYLDMLSQNSKSAGSSFVQLSSDEYSVSFPLCRSVKEVWVTTATAKWQLEKMSLQDLIYNYYRSNVSVDSGAPLYYSPVITRVIPEGTDLTGFSSYLNYIDTTSTTYDYNAIVIAPPTDEELLVEVKGFFYSKELTNDQDSNYWSEMFPSILIRAAMRELELYNQNESKAKLWESYLITDMIEISKDLVEQSISEVDQMEG